MNIALFSVPGVLAPLQGLWRKFTTNATQSSLTHSSTDPCTNEIAIHSVANNIHFSRVERQIFLKTAARRPLRIVRVIEDGQAPANVGRMVISGRMVDVCAELDRLAAREAALH